MAVEQPVDESVPCEGLTAFQIDALAAVAKLDRPHGLAVKGELENRHGEVFHGRLYPNLDTLVVKGLIKKGDRDGRSNWYDTTPTGDRELAQYQAWLAECQEGEQ